MTDVRFLHHHESCVPTTTLTYTYRELSRRPSLTIVEDVSEEFVDHVGDGKNVFRLDDLHRPIEIRRDVGIVSEHVDSELVTRTNVKTLVSEWRNDNDW